jgi:hypothetical protein
VEVGLQVRRAAIVRRTILKAVGVGVVLKDGVLE